MDKSEFLTTAQAAELIGIPMTTLRKWLREGVIKATKKNNKWLVERQHAEAVKSDNEKKGTGMARFVIEVEHRMRGGAMTPEERENPTISEISVFTGTSKFTMPLSMPDVVRHRFIKIRQDGSEIDTKTKEGQTEILTNTLEDCALFFTQHTNDSSDILVQLNEVILALPIKKINGYDRHKVASIESKRKKIAEQIDERNRELIKVAREYDVHAYDLLRETLKKTGAQGRTLSARDKGGIYGFHTSQEVQAMGYLLTDGATGANFTKNEAEGMVLHQREGAPFRIALSTQRYDGKPLETLDDIMQEISEIGGIQALKEFNYILWQLIPAEGETFAEGWLDFGDIWKYTGKSSRSKAARLKAYEHIWRVIKFCEQAEVFGARKGKYLIDGKEIDTTITGQPFWHISQKEYNEGETIPAKALLTTPPIMRKLLHTPQLQQYLGYGHLIGGIPSGRAAGAWAVSIGLTFLNHLRINLDNGHNLTRRTLLSKYPSEISPYTEVLAGNDPRRAIKYWVDALQILCEQGLIQKEGEALATVKSIRKGLPRYDWQEQFLNQSVVLIPSTREGLKKAIDDIAKNKYKPKPKNLKAPKKRRKKCE